ncbi:MAG TPA: hypothetical protein VIU93_06650 [Gallionellaceae bacterium]
MTPASAQGLADYALTLIEGEELMFTMEVPYVPAQETPIVLAQAGTAAAPPQPDFILNSCQETQSTGSSTSAVRGVDPGTALANALSYIAGKDVAPDLSVIKNITLLEGPKHGELVAGTSTSGRTAYRYDPIPEYVGDDRAVFMAEFKGKHYKIVVNLKVSIVVDYNSPLCPANPYKLIKVTKPSSGSTGIDSGVGNGISLSTLSVTFADLTGAALGPTTGTTITFDTNAAGNGWFIDSVVGRVTPAIS